MRQNNTGNIRKATFRKEIKKNKHNSGFQGPVLSSGFLILLKTASVQVSDSSVEETFWNLKVLLLVDGRRLNRV